MKNPYLERVRSGWRQRLARRPLNLSKGLDLSFGLPDCADLVINGVEHQVACLHPRSDFLRQLYKEAHDELANSFSPSEVFGAVFGRRPVTEPPALQAAVHDLVQTRGIVGTPHLRTKWRPFGKVVECYYPVEITNKEQLIEFALKVRDHLRGGRQLDFEAVSPYTRDTWNAEQPASPEHA